MATRINKTQVISAESGVVDAVNHAREIAEMSFDSSIAENTAPNEKYSSAIDSRTVQPNKKSATQNPKILTSKVVSSIGQVQNSYDAARISNSKAATDQRQNLIQANGSSPRTQVVNREDPAIKSSLVKLRYTVTHSANATDLKNQSQQFQNNEEVIGSSIDISNGIQPKPDLRATLQVFPQTSPNVILTDFFITDVQEEVAEKFQIIETFSTDFIFFFGQRPRIYAISGVLYNSLDKQWKNNMKYIYDKALRGTELARLKRRAILTYDDVVREGYLLNFRHSLSSQAPNICPFSFSFYVTKEFQLTPNTIIEK